MNYEIFSFISLAYELKNNEAHTIKTSCTTVCKILNDTLKVRKNPKYHLKYYHTT